MLKMMLRRGIRFLCFEYGIYSSLKSQAFTSFRRYCNLPTSDLRQPASWYRTCAESTGRSGVYWGLLKLMASEVYNKSNQRETPRNLVTGEERKFADPHGNPSKQVACTVDLDYDALQSGRH